MTEHEKLKRIDLYESLGISQDEMEWRLRKDENLESDSWWGLIRDEKFSTLKELPEDASWTYTSIEEELAEKCYDAQLTESSRTTDIKPGDIVLVSQFNNANGDSVDNKEHRLIVIGDDEKNNITKRTYFGFYMSSQVDKANKYNKKFPKNIYINDYNTILKSGMHSTRSEVFVNLAGICEFNQKDVINIVGHISDEFDAFLKNTVGKSRRKEDTTEVFWER